MSTSMSFWDLENVHMKTGLINRRTVTGFASWRSQPKNTGFTASVYVGTQDLGRERRGYLVSGFFDDIRLKNLRITPFRSELLTERFRSSRKRSRCIYVAHLARLWERKLMVKTLGMEGLFAAMEACAPCSQRLSRQLDEWFFVCASYRSKKKSVNKLLF